MPKGKEIRRSFSREFKVEAVRRLQARPEGVSVAHIGRELAFARTCSGRGSDSSNARAMPRCRTCSREGAAHCG